MKYTKQQWYTPAEVAVHDTARDCWVSLNGKVLNMTSWLDDQFRLCACTLNCTCVVKSWYCGAECVEYCPCFKRGYFYCDKRRLAMSVLAYAGKDISHWFRGQDWVQYTHPVACCTTVYRPFGHGVNEPVTPSPKWRPYQKPWWLDESLIEGNMTARTRPIRITNTITENLDVHVDKSVLENVKQLKEVEETELACQTQTKYLEEVSLMTGSTVTLEVCSEETIYEIMMRYLPHNSHMMSYTWRYLEKPLCYNWTLEKNGIPDERDRFSDVLLPENVHIPAILIYYNDDLTENIPRHDCYCKNTTCILTKPEKCYRKLSL